MKLTEDKQLPECNGFYFHNLEQDYAATYTNLKLFLLDNFVYLSAPQDVTATMKKCTITILQKMPWYEE